PAESRLPAQGGGTKATAFSQHPPARRKLYKREVAHPLDETEEQRMDAQVEQFRAFSTTTISDALDRLGIAGQVFGITPLELGYPIFSRGVYMRTGKDRVQADGMNIPISLGEVRVEPGDMLVGDADGVLVVPAGREAEVLGIAGEITEAEDRIRQEIEQGS